MAKVGIGADLLGKTIRSIGAISESLPADIKGPLKALREVALALSLADNPVVRASDLKALGVIANFTPTAGVTPTPTLDTTPPPAPTGLAAAGALANVILSWDKADINLVSYTEIWRAQANDFASAQLVGQAPTGASVYVDNIGAGATRYYWIRFVSYANVTGSFNAQAGVAGTTGYDASYLLDVLKANPPVGATYNPLLYVQAADQVISGVTVPAGVYMTAAYIRALSVTNAMIANAAIDDAKIANLNAGKINAGDVAAARMQANVVTAVSAAITNLSALKASLGTVQIDTSGYLRTAGALAYDVGLGIWMGYDVTTQKYLFRVGDPAVGGKSMFWDGTNLNINGTLAARSVIGSMISTNTLTTDLIVSRSATALDYFSRSIDNNVNSAFSFTMDHDGYCTAFAYVNYGFNGNPSPSSWRMDMNIDGVGATNVTASNFSVAQHTLAVNGFFAAGTHTVNVTAYTSIANPSPPPPHAVVVFIFKSYR